MRVLAGWVCGGILVCGIVTAQAAEWSQFRGPNNSGLPEASQLPTEWSKDKNIQWKIEIPGVAWSCPIVWGDKIFVTTAVTEKQQKPKVSSGGGFGGGGFGGGGFGGGRGDREGGQGYGPPGGEENRKEGDAKKDGPPKEAGKKRAEGGKEGDRGGRGRRGGGRRGGGGGWGNSTPPDVVYHWEIHCLDRVTGKTLWKQTALERKPTVPIHSTNSYASETPVTDGERVYAYFGMHGLFAYNVDGSFAWKADLGSFPMMAGWGTGSSPALDGDRIFVQCDNEKESFLAAFDKKTGKELWRKKRDEPSSWSTPFIWRTKGRTEVVACGRKRIRSYNPANGEVLWELGELSGNWSATPVANEEMLFIGTGGPRSDGPLFAVKAGASGDITLKEGETKNAGIAWSRTKAGPPMASPLLYQGRLYVLEQRGGTISCYDAKTGEPSYYRQRIPEASGFTSSPWAYDGKVFCLDAKGETFVLKAGPEFAVLGQNKLDAEEECWSTPAFTADTLLLRTMDHLYSIKK